MFLKFELSLSTGIRASYCSIIVSKEELSSKSCLGDGEGTLVSEIHQKYPHSPQLLCG